jgi:hypothetical protein
MNQLPPGPWQPAQPPKRPHRGRYVLAVVVILIVVIAIAASKSSTPGTGTPSHPAAADISIGSCSVDASLGIPTARGTIINHSSATSDYTFTVSFLNSAGTVVAQGGGIENDIAAHQSASFSVEGDQQVSGPVTCKVVDVSRFASS